MVFQESIKQRFERAKAKYERDNDKEFNNEYLEAANNTLKNILAANNIKEVFAHATYTHFTNKSKKKNNLCFFGPVSTGKTMIMTSLVDAQFNYCRLTGLTPDSSLNFSGLFHCNACLMDESKIKENQFEQWKLLASGMPMSTDVKYKDRCDVQRCTLYTCSNYPIAMYCKVPMAKQALDKRTITFVFKIRFPQYTSILPHTWEDMWSSFDLYL